MTTPAYGERQSWGPDDYQEFLRIHFDDPALSSDRFNDLANECNDRYGTEM